MRIQKRKTALLQKAFVAITTVLAISLVAVGPTTAGYAAKSADNGFNDKGYNYQARLYSHFYPTSPDAYLVMKWSKDWTPMANEPVGAWTTNHWTWYSNDYDESTWYGWNNMQTFGSGTYRMEEFLKIQKVSDDAAAWAQYSAGDAYDAGWGTYSDGVPMYVVFQDVVTVSDAQTGNVIATYNLTTQSPKGLGKPIF